MGFLRVMKVMGFWVTLARVQSPSVCSVRSVELCVTQLAVGSSVCTVVSGYQVPFWAGQLDPGEVGSSEPDYIVPLASRQIVSQCASMNGMDKCMYMCVLIELIV